MFSMVGIDFTGGTFWVPPVFSCYFWRSCVESLHIDSLGGDIGAFALCSEIE